MHWKKIKESIGVIKTFEMKTKVKQDSMFDKTENGVQCSGSTVSVLKAYHV